MKTIQPLFGAAAIAVVALLVATGCGGKHDHSSHSHGSAASESAATTGAKPYPLSKCIVTDEAFDHGKPYTFVHKGQEIKLCCKDCLEDFNKEPAKYLNRIEDEAKKQREKK